MKTIWKYVEDIRDTISIVMPVGSRILSAELIDGDLISVWAEVDTRVKEKETRMMFVRGTGYPLLGNEGYFLGTFQSYPFVWHVYADYPEERRNG